MFLWRLLTENFSWKLLSLCAAILIWVAVASEPEVQTVVSVPVEYRNVPRSLEMGSDIASTVKLELSGLGGQLSSFEASPAPVVLDFRQVNSPGERTFGLSEQNVRLPRGVTLVRAVPGQLRMRFETRLTREVPVDVRWIGSPPRGTHVASIEVLPPKLSVVGPESGVNLVESIRTDPVNLETLQSGNWVTTSPYVDQPEVRFVNYQPVRVRVILNK